MKIGIITFHASFNYGSMLQAWALQTFLEKQGHEVKIINFRQKSQKIGYDKPIALSSLPNVKRSVKRLLLAPATIRPLYRKWHLFDGFMHKWQNLTDEYNTLDELEQARFGLDALITGSDQIWNTTVFDFSEAYFGTFVDGNTMKIAYAPSMGPAPENQDVAYLKKLLNGYKAVSVREERTRKFLEGNGICNNVSVVLDPTMLLDAADYDVLYDKKPLIDGQYVFYYTPGSGPRHEFLSEAAYIGKRLDLPVVCDNCYTPGALRGYDNVHPHVATGPAEFLNLVKNAAVVCGASFHLMVFSILFRKDFYCMNGDFDSRMNNLMKNLCLEDRIWSITDKNLNRIVPTEYTAAFAEAYGREKSKSQEFLKDALTALNR